MKVVGSTKIIIRALSLFKTCWDTLYCQQPAEYSQQTAEYFQQTADLCQQKAEYSKQTAQYSKQTADSLLFFLQLRKFFNRLAILQAVIGGVWALLCTRCLSDTLHSAQKHPTKPIARS